MRCWRPALLAVLVSAFHDDDCEVAGQPWRQLRDELVTNIPISRATPAFGSRTCVSRTIHDPLLYANVTMRATFVLLLFLLAAGDDGDVTTMMALKLGMKKVKVQLYFETGCPFCQEAITGPFNKILSTESVAAIMDIELYPFGNSYFLTSECQGGDEYDVKVRKCYNQLCGLDASDRPQDCFTGNVVCQHGPLECKMDRYVACAKRLTNFEVFMAFTHCVEAGYGNQTEALVSSCAASSQIDAKALGQCFGGPQGDDAVKAQAMATPDHLGVPSILLNGKPVEEGKDLLKEVCKAYKGPTPKACASWLDAVA
eukprot:s1013_g21.t1